MLSSNKQLTWQFLIEHAYAPWDTSGLCENTALPLNKILHDCQQSSTQRFRQWDIALLSRRSDVTYDMVHKHSELPWDFDALLDPRYDQDIALIDVINSYPRLQWSMRNISQHPDMSLQIVIQHLNWCWHWESLSKNTAFDFNSIIHTLFRYPWHVGSLSRHARLSFEFVFRFPLLTWDWKALSAHPNLHMNMVMTHLGLPWNWSSLSRNINLHIEHVVPLLRKPWDWDALTRNPNIGLANIFIHFRRLPWVFPAICGRPDVIPYLSHVQEEYVMQKRLFRGRLRKITWNWTVLSRNPYLTAEHVRQYFEIPWCAVGLSKNPSFTYHDLLTCTDLVKGMTVGLLSSLPQLNIRDVMDDDARFADYMWILSANESTATYRRNSLLSQLSMSKLDLGLPAVKQSISPVTSISEAPELDLITSYKEDYIFRNKAGTISGVHPDCVTCA